MMIEEPQSEFTYCLTMLSLSQSSRRMGGWLMTNELEVVAA
jgi:hypothetical protein